MSDVERSNEKKLKIVSPPPKVVVLNNKAENQEESGELPELEEETIIVAPIFADVQEQMVENISEIVDQVYIEFSSACEQRNLNWEAELEFGLELGVRFAAKLKISPREPKES
ncbi:hypothetical protein D0962_02665 [Leptolyngbyaceae cyanobacterium CCMR0082]|uniref:Uncharacterized protein n=1 Tax=Adonisia turfae CCMR0082 TaxID=2304604 RepID=A0A6M0RZL9_9CYAN|nr:hypothetical protein [Adonisia turfae]NEZ61689.1 hypothetical protein [Adonisia turfae CCMR0082]